VAEARTRRAVVIGAGLAGLAAGYRLVRAGWDVLVLERESEVGGRCRTVNRGGFRFDTGAQHFRDSYDATLKTAIEIGLGDRFRIPISGAGVFDRGKVVPFVARSMNPVRLLPWGALGPRGAVDVLSLAVPFLRGYRSYDIRFPHRWTGGDRLTAADFIASRTSPDFLSSFADSLCCYALGAEPERVSAAAFMAAVRATFADRIGCFTGGIGLLPCSLAKRMRVVCNMEARQVVQEGGMAVAVKARPTSEGRLRSYRADLVVCAVPAPLVTAITGGLASAAERVISETKYSPGIVVHVGFSEEVVGPAGPVLLPATEGFRARCALTHWSKSIEYAPPGATALTLVYSGSEAAAIIGEEDSVIIEMALGEARRVFSLVGRRPVESRVDRHHLGRPVVSPGHAGSLRELWRAGSGIKNLVLVGDWTMSPTIEGAVSSGFHAAGSAVLHG
jgi:oxygen-dependent protoporphyrinogen oxidase